MSSLNHMVLDWEETF